MATRAEIEAALAHYEQVGNADAARKLKATLGAMAPDRDGTSFSAPPKPPGPSLADRAVGEAKQAGQNFVEGGKQVFQAGADLGQEIVGAAETGATLTTGMLTSPAAALGGALYETARQILNGEYNPNDRSSINQFAERAAAEATYVPRTQAGQRNVQAVGEVLEPAIPYLNALGPLGVVEAQGIRGAVQGAKAAALASGVPSKVARAVRAAGDAAGDVAVRAGDTVVEAAGRTGDAARAAASRAGEAVSDAARAARDALPPLPGREPPTGGGNFGPGSAGAAAVPVEDLRVAKAAQLPVPVKYTKAQRTRKFEDQKLERETLGKDTEIGAPIREHYREQHEQIAANVDRLIESSGATKTDSLRGIGETVVAPIVGKLQSRKAKVRVKYTNAEKAGELEAPVELKGFVQYLNDNKTLSASVLKDVRSEIVRIGAAARNKDGTLVPKAVTLKQGEQLRQFITEATDDASRKEVRQSTRLKKAYDTDTDGAGGVLYKEARAEHARLQRDFENANAVSRLLKNKRGTGDRKVAFEDVLARTVTDDAASLDQLKSVTRVLQQAGPEGRQALKELRGGTLEWIKREATKSVAANQAETGARTVSPTGLHRAIEKLDRSGKLEHLFGKKNAETLRILDEVAQDVLTAPPGTVNTSGTASAVAALLDLSLAAGTGIPVPVATGLKLLSKQVRNAKLRAKVQEHLK